MFSHHYFTLSRNYNTYSGEDYFYGKISNIPIEFSELKVELKSKNSTHTAFHGCFIVVHFVQNFTDKMVVIPDPSEKHLGAFGKFIRNLHFMRDHLVKIDYRDFEMQFTVYSNNEKEAQKVLDPKLCKYLIELKRHTRDGVFFGYNENRFFVGIFNRKDMFKVDIKQTITKELLIGYYNELTEILNIAINFYAILEENFYLRTQK